MIKGIGFIFSLIATPVFASEAVVSFLQYESLKGESDIALKIHLYDGALETILDTDSPYFKCVQKIDDKEIQREACEFRISKNGFEKVGSLDWANVLPRQWGDTSLGWSALKKVETKKRIRFKGQVANMINQVLRGNTELTTKAPRYKDREESQNDQLRCKWYIFRTDKRPIGYPDLVCETMLDENGNLSTP